MMTITPKRLRALLCTCIYLSYILSIFANYIESHPYLKLTHSSSALFNSVEYLNVTKDLGSNTHHGRPWMQIHTSNFDRQHHT